MAIIFHEKSKEFHLFNKEVSYIIQILDNNQLGNLYFGKYIHDKEDLSYLVQGRLRSLAVYNRDNYYHMSPQYTTLEYPAYGTGDFRYPAYEIKQNNGSRVSFFEYESFQIIKGKKILKGLPATYVEKEEEADTLEITLRDSLIGTKCILSYSIFRDFPVITRSCLFINQGKDSIVIERALSLCLDFPDCDYEMVHLAGAWSRERHVKVRKLEQGVQSIYSMRGASSAEHNPFIALKRPNADENSGEVYGFSLVYSGNYLGQVEVDTNQMTRVLLGIHPDTFEWPLNQEESFQTPEAILVYSDQGINKMSQTFHKLYRTRLVRGMWRDKDRPILINNWEATETQFTQDIILKIAKAGKELGMELFVLDDGWFGNRENDKTGLGDWYVTNFEKLPDGISGLADKIEKLGMKFGLWFEPEMVNKDSELFRKHPDWILCAPGRYPSPSRNQHVLDFSREEVIDYIYGLIEKVLSEAKISYVKWDMNRYITECYSIGKDAENQGKVFHQYILGVYKLYERLLKKFPYILFESCSSGGARFDPGMLYYAPQTWTSDNTDAIERLKIQYGTSFVYPISSMAAHVSEIPNQQVGRKTPIETRGNVAQFGVFGFELDLSKITKDEMKIIKEQISFTKKHRKLIQQGIFYRMISPFEGESAAWIVVSEDKTQAIAAYYKILNTPNSPFIRLRLVGLSSDKQYYINDDYDCRYYGDELMQIGIVLNENIFCPDSSDFSSVVFYLKEVD